MRKPITQAEILIAGPARNNADTLVAEVGTLLSSVASFKKSYCLVVESDSTDSTLDYLERLQKAIPSFDYISLGHLAKKMPRRTERLAFARNRILDELRNNPKYAAVDYVVMADLDGINRSITREKFEACWELSNPWDVVTAIQSERYYDIWALRHPDWNPIDCFTQRSRLESVIGKEAANNLAVKAKQVVLPSAGMIEVDSAFGGLGIYKRDALLAGRYIGLDDSGNEACEHISLHADLRNEGYRIFINCALVNSAHHIDPPPPPPKGRTMAGIKFLQKIGITVFGEERFHKYLDLLKKS
ncbi:glycosyltransferase family 2 protein [Polynucleobacter sp. 15G-AUS-farblos]|uniref:glycosyltransferase family A protein n=1 Tax=Polynucleobacter sp. 15G-AUS-farblos TaxID=2689094 RepID=UPI001C0CFFD2|nr:glycosyltransferase family A protein [Polynucleobacter sp. 15G-AUS-farblos]MBU3583490.1 glycosyltransferase family 2 protein [Polynucleobacter sp. 15G-AUS-farblos]